MNWNSADNDRLVNSERAISTIQPWRSPPPAIILGKNDVHVWQAALDELLPKSKALLSTLSADERSRAERFYFRKDREHFIAAHGTLRAILALYLDRPPERLLFHNGLRGKPALVGESDGEAINFNMSHSHGMALYAVARDRAVGVDLEFAHKAIEAEQIAERFFSHHEVEALHALPAASRKYAFFLCWTRKEAYIKAKGEGLSTPLDQFDVSLAPGERSALLNTRPDPDEATRWSLQELSFSPDYAAALAVEGSITSLSCWRWPRSLRGLA